MANRRPAILAAGLICGLALNMACDRKWDFECTAVWTDDGREVWRKVITYPEMADETAATAHCKEEMLEARPKGANAATCHCVGIE
jgi:hypothetical protein